VRYALVPIAVLALAGCGGGNDESSAVGTTTAESTGKAVQISLVDFAIKPGTVTLDAPGNYTFEVTNDGQTQHALEIEGNGVEEETDTLGPGESGEVTVELAAGEYELYCPVDGHRANGMEGTLVVSG
jgi:VCBS repeat-containing protein